MRHERRSIRASRRKTLGFTLADTVISVGLAALTFTGVVYGYTFTSDRAQWSSCSLAAQSLAIQGVEQARAAKWDPAAWPPIDELGTTNYVQVSQLDFPVAKANIVFATNYVSVRTVSVAPPVRQLRADCVWRMLNGCRTRGLYTNTVVTLRAPDR